MSDGRDCTAPYTANPNASAASSGLGTSVNESMRMIMSCTCLLSAFPSPAMADLS